MNNIRIALLDSGVSAKVINEKKIIGRKGFYYDYYDEKIITEDNTEDLNGHGTMCAETILDEFSCVEFYIIRMLNVSGITSESVLTEALKFAGDLDVDIITVCSSVRSGTSSDQLKDICDRIRDKGKIIVTAVENGKNKSVPASYDSVIGVIGGDLPEKKYCFDIDSDIQMQCSSSAAVVSSSFGIRSFIQGNSRAAALASAYIARTMYESGVYGMDVCKYLAENSVSSSFKDQYSDDDHIHKIPFDYEKENYYVSNSSEYQKFIYTLCEFFLCDTPSVVRFGNLLELNNRFMLRNLENCLSFLEERFSVKCKKNMLEDLMWAYLFYEKIIKGE